MAEKSYEIEEELAVLSVKGEHVTVEANMISYRGGRPKLDIRKWYREDLDEHYHSKDVMWKGITLSWEETQKLKEVLNELSEMNFK